MCFRFDKSQRFRRVAVFIKSKISSFKLFYFTFFYHLVNVFKSLPFKRYFESGNKNMYNHRVINKICQQLCIFSDLDKSYICFCLQNFEKNVASILIVCKLFSLYLTTEIFTTYASSQTVIL